MKDRDEEIMDQLEGRGESTSDPKLMDEVKELKGRIGELKKLPILEVNKVQNTRFEGLLVDLKAEGPASRGRLRRQRIRMTVYLAAACLAIVFLFNWPEKEEPLKTYESLVSNPEKLNLIHDLGQEELDPAEIIALQQILQDEDQPNLKVAIIDLLNGQLTTTRDPSPYLTELEQPNAPTVQMALLDLLDKTETGKIFEPLSTLLDQKEFDPSVAQRIETILSINQKSEL